MSRRRIQECVFLDVGSGTSNIVLLGGRRAIVIDCGRSSKVPMRVLKRYVDIIEVLAVSHNDADHCGGAAQVVTAFPRAIKKLLFLQDREPHKIGLLGLLKEEVLKGNLNREAIARFEVTAKQEPIFVDPDTDLTLKILSPDVLLNVESQTAADANSTSGVLVLCYGKNKIVFPGDSDLAAWELIKSRNGRLDCDIFVVPHHGGLVSEQRSNEDRVMFVKRMRVEQEWFYGNAVQPKSIVISTGSSNDYGHPRPEVIEAVQNASARIMCTQITERCWARSLEELRPGVLNLSRLSDPEDIVGIRQSVSSAEFTSGGRSKNVACAGTMVAQMDGNSVSITTFESHREAVDRLARCDGGRPLCRNLSVRLLPSPTPDSLPC